MMDPTKPGPPGDTVGAVAPVPPPSRARALRMTLASLTGVEGVQGGLIVTPDGFVITSELPPRYSPDALGALGATLGRELELGAERLGRGAFEAAHFASSDGAIFVGGSPVGFVILIGDQRVDVRSVLRRIAQARHELS
jgi:predicted regulator of Ras-like GTPase activity (Roadblock/LC7/MglB family)